jgi:hypothetical protein
LPELEGKRKAVTTAGSQVSTFALETSPETMMAPFSTTSDNQDKRSHDNMLEEGNFWADSSTTNIATTSIPAPPPPQQTRPGAFRVPGIDGENENDDDDSVMNTTVASSRVDRNNPVAAELVDEDEERRRIQVEIDRGVAAQRERERMEREGEIPEAEVVIEKNRCSTRVKIWSGAAAVLVIAAIILVTVFRRPSPQEVPQELASLLSLVSFDNGTALQTPWTPQNNAANWLANNANLTSYSNEKKIQRYTLAVLHYSTNGNNWIGKDGWLSNEEECDWYNTDDGSFCKNGSVVVLGLYDNNLVGKIPNELALLSSLSESSIAWLLVVTILVMFFIVL